MTLEDFKDKLGDDFPKLAAFVQAKDDALAAAAEKDAKNRLKFKEVADDRDALRRKHEALSEHFGIDDETDLATLPKGKDAVEAAKQYEQKLKRLQRERDEAVAARDEAAGKFRTSTQRAAVADAMAGHKFVARDLVETYVSQRLVWEGDDLLYKGNDGKSLPLKDAVAGIAKTRPELLEAAGSGGSGARPAGSGGGKDLSHLSPVERINAARSVKAA